MKDASGLLNLLVEAAEQSGARVGAGLGALMRLQGVSAGT
jgi:hypothetical protein